MSEEYTCNCTHCTNHRLYKWAVVMECGCCCHNGDGIMGHSSLCCEVPNALRKNNPHKDLKEASYYKKIMDDWCKED